MFISSTGNKFLRNGVSIRSTQEPLSDEAMKKVAPSVFAVEKHESRSKRYTYIPTIDVLNGLRKEGFEPFFVSQSRSRDDTRKDFTKHCIRLRRAGQLSAEESTEIILLNSHDGTSSYQMLAGMYRQVCSNGLVYFNNSIDIRVPHKGDVVGQVIEGAYKVLGHMEEVQENKLLLEGVNLSQEERHLFAKSALALKFDGDIEECPIEPYQVLNAKRSYDQKPDLWTTFNVVQENLIRGGLRYSVKNEHGRAIRNMRTREIVGLDQNIKLNRALWLLAEGMRELHSR